MSGVYLKAMKDHIALASALMVLCGCAQAQTGNSADQRLADIADLIKNKQFVLKKGAHQPDFCDRFLDDLSNRREIKIHQPVAAADSYEDSAFDEYHLRCPELHTLPYAMYSPGLMEVCSANFEAYIGEFDDDPANGQEYVLRCNRIINPYPPKSGVSKGDKFSYDDLIVYGFADLKECKQIGYTPGHGDFDYEHQQESQHRSALIEYRERSYVLQVSLSKRRRSTHVSTHVSISRIKKVEERSHYLKNWEGVCYFKTPRTEE